VETRIGFILSGEAVILKCATPVPECPTPGAGRWSRDYQLDDIPCFSIHSFIDLWGLIREMLEVLEARKSYGNKNEERIKLLNAFRKACRKG
jgi:hypothetical protein